MIKSHNSRLTEVKEQNNKLLSREGKKGYERFYGIIEETQMEDAGKFLLNVFRTKGNRAAKEFYTFLHSATKDYLKQDSQYKPYILHIEQILLSPLGELDDSPKQRLLEAVVLHFKAHDYQTAALLADKFSSKYSRGESAICHALHEPMVGIIRSNIGKAESIAAIFKQFGFMNWVDCYGKADTKLNKPRRRS
jgi:uncharacterized protein YaaW (UPF0174 family)